MANSAGIYLQLDGQILLLCDQSWGQVPNGIGIAKFTETAARLGLAAGDCISSSNGCLQFGQQWIKIAETENQPLSSGRKLEPDNWRKGILALRGRESGLAPLVWEPEKTPLCTLAGPRLELLCQGLKQGNKEAVEEGVKGLLGLGPGLTPSADDVLCGMMYGLLRSDETMAQTLKAAVCAYADSRTNAVSAAYLKAIAQGEYFSRMDNVWRFFTGQGQACLNALLEVGSSSGADMLLGLCLAGKLSMETEEWTDG